MQLERALIWAEADVLLIAVGKQTVGPVFAQGVKRKSEQKRAHTNNQQKHSEADERQKLLVSQALDEANMAKAAIDEEEEAVREAEEEQAREDGRVAARHDEAAALQFAAAVELEREDWLFAAELEEEAEMQHLADDVDSGITAQGC